MAGKIGRTVQMLLIWPVRCSGKLSEVGRRNIIVLNWLGSLAYHRWLAKHSKHAKKQKNEIAENLMNVSDRHLDEGFGGKRGKITKEDREKNRDRLKNEGSEKKDTKANFEKRYAKFASGSDSKRKAEIQKRKRAKAALEAGSRNGGEFDHEEDEEEDDDEDGTTQGKVARTQSG